MGNTLALETAEDLNITELRNVNEILDECEPGETIELINRSEIILDGCKKWENISEGVSKQVEEKIKTQKLIYKKDYIKMLYNESEKKHKNRISLKLPNTEFVNSEFREKLMNLQT